MPSKRLSPASDSRSDAAGLPLKRTQRTHEENQERAYIAASRRADRDIEHRIRSALKASECRKKRTGRGLKITREAVMGDEQYESDDNDDTARRSRAQANASLSNPSIGDRADRYAEVNALFAKHFPHVQLSSRWSTQTQHQFSYPPPIQTQATFNPRCQQAGVVAAPTARHPSPPITPPTSYPLPPAREKAGSMSPLALDGSPTRPAGATSHSPLQSSVGLEIVDHPDPGITTAYLLNADAEHQLFQDAQGVHLYSTGRAAPTSMVQEPYDLATGAAGSTWFGQDVAPTGGEWQLRSLSPPAALESYPFPLEMTATTTTAMAVPPTPAPEAIDPAILASTADGTGTGNTTPPNEPWADWVNLDEDSLPPLAVKG